MAFSKVTLNGTTLMDVTQKTVTAGTMLSGTTALKNDGTDITGSIASQASATITPTTSQQVAVAAGKYTTGDVVVAPIPSNYIIPTGSFSAISNGIYNITSYASVIVDVANTIVPEGTNVSVDGTTLIFE